MTSVDFACADCLEDAGGRQRKHNIAWHLDICPVCGEETAVTRPEYFGSPELTLKVLPFSAQEEAA